MYSKFILIDNLRRKLQRPLLYFPIYHQMTNILCLKDWLLSSCAKFRKLKNGESKVLMKRPNETDFNWLLHRMESFICISFVFYCVSFVFYLCFICVLLMFYLCFIEMSKWNGFQLTFAETEKFYLCLCPRIPLPCRFPRRIQLFGKKIEVEIPPEKHK